MVGQWTKSYNTPDPLLLTSPKVFTECCVCFCIFRFLLSRYPGKNACVLRESRGRCGCCRTTPAPISAELPTLPLESRECGRNVGETREVLSNSDCSSTLSRHGPNYLLPPADYFRGRGVSKKKIRQQLHIPSIFQ